LAGRKWLTATPGASAVVEARRLFDLSPALGLERLIAWLGRRHILGEHLYCAVLENSGALIPHMESALSSLSESGANAAAWLLHLGHASGESAVVAVLRNGDVSLQRYLMGYLIDLQFNIEPQNRDASRMSCSLAKPEFGPVLAELLNDVDRRPHREA
jgi:hypothetical protein